MKNGKTDAGTRTSNATLPAGARENLASIADVPPWPIGGPRLTEHDGSCWRWVDERKRALEPGPTVPEIVGDKCAEHGVGAVEKIIGLSRQTVLSAAAGVIVNAASAIVVQLRLVGLAQLDGAADYRSKEATAPKNGAHKP